MKSIFDTLSAINCNEHTEKKNGLTYLSWAWAWHNVKREFPDATYTIYETPEGRPYFDDGRTCWVKTGVTIQGLEHIEYLPIMDYKNQSIPLAKVTSMDMNKTIQRSLTKACARHGLGLYIYAGEDLPEELDAQPTQEQEPKPKKTAKKTVESKPEPKKSNEEIRTKWIEAIAKGIKTKNGTDPREAFINNFHPTEDSLAALDEDVIKYRLEHGIKANEING